MIGAAGFQKAPEALTSDTEGWTWLHNAKKWHYFRGGKSMCGQWQLFKHPNEGYEIGNENSTDNCKACKRALLKERGELK